MGQNIVYIIDDDEDVRASAAFLLDSFGISCRTFDRADIFLDTLASLPPGCILSDLRMPGLSGLDLQTELLRRSFDWPLIFMTGHGDIPTVVHALKKGALEFIEKPFTDERLLAVLNDGFALVGRCRKSECERVREALQQGNILPHYQPKVDLRSGTVVGFEALLRWDTQRSATERCKAIHDAYEDPALGSALTERMLDCIMADIKGWIEAGTRFGHVSINASSCDIEDPAYADRLLARLEEAGVPASAIQVEVTETVTLDPQAHVVRETLDKLFAAGITIALDDFGTGFASLTHLQNLPVQVIKIDRAFVATLEDKSSASIVKAIVGLARGLGKEVVAEGVETRLQARFLSANGCDFAQGYLFGPGLPAAEVPAALERSTQAA